MDDPAAYGAAWADVYDRLHPADASTEAVADAVATLAADGQVATAARGRVLELGVGTGRIALPLTARGVLVAGLDASPAMVERLRAKPGGDAIPVTVGDMTATRVPAGPDADRGEEGDGNAGTARFAVVLLAFNTVFAPLTQERQVACFRNAAAHLADGGVFAIECFVPDPTRFAGGQAVRTTRVDDDAVWLETAVHDPVAQTVDSALVRLGGGAVDAGAEASATVRRVRIRYAWPAELDLMARLAGLRLRTRHGGWRGEPFTAASGAHVSLYERDPSGGGGQGVGQLL